MKTKYKYIHFAERDSTGRKTSIWRCLNNISHSLLGKVKWHGAWRQYCFLPEANTVFNRGCNNDINDFITQLMDERKG